MASASLVLKNDGSGTVTVDLADDVGDAFNLEITVKPYQPPVTGPGGPVLGWNCKLRVDKEAVRRFLDVLLEEEEVEDVPDPSAEGSRGKSAGG